MAFNIVDHYLPMKKLTKHDSILLIFDPTLLMLFLFT